MTDQVHYQAKDSRIISVRVVREPDQCTGRQDVRKYSVDSINEQLIKSIELFQNILPKDLINIYIYIN